MSIVQGRQGLFDVALGRRNGGNDRRLCTTTQGVLKNTSEFAFPNLKEDIASDTAKYRETDHFDLSPR